MSAQLTALDDVRARCIAWHEDVRFQAGPSCVSGKRSASIAGAGNGELDCAEVFCHGHSDTHPTRFETLRGVYRFVLDPEIDVVAKFLCAQ